MGLTAEQLAIRKNGIGGSDAPVVVGVSPYKTPLQLWLEKRGDAVDQEETEVMFWGTRLEDTIAEVYAEKTGHQIRRQPTRFSKEHPFMLVNMDRQIINHPRGPGYLEVKNFGQWSAGHIQSEDDIQDYVKIQLQHGLAVTGYQWGAYAILIGGQRLFIGQADRDQEVIDFLIEAESSFWRMVQEGIQPEVDGSPRTAKFLANLYPETDGEILTVEDPRITNLARDLVQIKDKLKTVEEEKEALGNFFKLYMQDSQILKIPGWGGVEWAYQKEKTKRVFDEAAFQAAHPSLYKKFSKRIALKGNRVFTVHPGKDYDKPKRSKIPPQQQPIEAA